MSEATIGHLITVGQWIIGGIVSLIIVGMRLSWQAGRTTSAVESGTTAVNELKTQLVKMQESHDKEIEQVNTKLEKHDGILAKHHGRLSALESAGGRSSGSWPGHEMGQS